MLLVLLLGINRQYSAIISVDATSFNNTIYASLCDLEASNAGSRHEYVNVRKVMFSSSGSFGEVDCPLQGECTLLRCIFRHRPVVVKEEVADFPEPAAKRRKPDQNSNVKADVPARHNDPSHVFTGTLVTERSTPVIDRPLTKTAQSAGNGQVKKGDEPRSRGISPAQRPISPPPVKRSDKSLDLPVTKSAKPAEALNPRMLAKAPADHKIRYIYLKKLHEGMVRLNTEAKASSDSSMKAVHVSDSQLVILALDEEERLAKENPGIYANVIKLRILAYSKKMTLAEWKAERLAAKGTRKQQASSSTQATSNDASPVLATGLLAKEDIQILTRLVADQRDLHKYGYVTSVPTHVQIQEASEVVRASQGFEQCDRCQARFQVFPERREDGALTTGGRCQHHHGRIAYPQRNSSGGYTGAKERLYNCCNEPIGQSLGCVYADTHVFKIDDANRMASVLQFAQTPDNADVSASAVSFDCEMGYTANGMELIRLTAVSWPEGKALLDVLVRPLGPVLDLNSRYSGVYPKDFLDAKPYDEREASCGELRIVDSPQEARRLLFRLLSPNTPLIGHAIENDLNTTRIVHPTIVDTVLLFPHPTGLPRRRALKALTKQVLGRDIQTGHGAAGHDSREDAIATGDLVRWQVAKKWKEMKREGWKVGEGMLIAPTTSQKLGKDTGSKSAVKRSLADFAAELKTNW